MENEEIINLLRRVIKTLQTNFKSQQKCKSEPEDRVNEMEEAAIKLGSEPFVKRARQQNVIEKLSTGLYSVEQPLSAIKPKAE